MGESSGMGKRSGLRMEARGGGAGAQGSRVGVGEMGATGGAMHGAGWPCLQMRAAM